ncbi:lipolytic enzyme, G-D-S-L family (plasmid) [Nostoc punctiforme PCC 73102]|uniref:Lipolytic enzyme, G-D-S-L family n=2 Tax=Nostoc punctiforme TaxID=272131 RepID=B2JBV3_NOSP7|nr:lipolytic enzyme, G-D-S-L family [Nostoc punctiforme PCC 73102]
MPFFCQMKKSILAVGILLVSSMFPIKVSAAIFDKIFVFGDDLSDTGNFFNATGQTSPSSPPFYQGRASNGPIWIDYLSQYLGLNPTPYTAVLGGASSSQGINYAYINATTGTANLFANLTSDPLLALGLQQEINAFTTTNPTADPNALYIVWAGAADYIPVTNSFQPYQTPTQTISNLSQAINSLVKVGAQNIFVPNLPDLGKNPYIQDTPLATPLNTLTSEHNADLAKLINIQNQSLDNGVKIQLFDVNSLFNAILSNPAKYGFTNVQDSCLDQLDPSKITLCGTQPNIQNQYLFWYSLEPTTAFHKIVADAAYQQLVPVHEPSTGLGLLALGAVSAIFVTRVKYTSRKAKMSQLSS